MQEAHPPLGVTIVHSYYPGFIDVPSNSQYIIQAHGLRGSVHVLAHIRPLVVVDFDNELVEKINSSTEKLIDIRNPILSIEPDNIRADATGFEGRTAPTIVIEKSLNGRVFFQEMYTSLHICFEYSQKRQASNLTSYRILLEHFIGTYRYLNPDVRLAISDAKPEESTPLRMGHYRYSPEEQTMPFEERITNAWPDTLQLTIVAVGRSARALQDHVGDDSAVIKRAEQLGSYLSKGFALSESLLEIERLADLAFNLKRPRSAIVEAMSILEVGIIAHQARMETRLKQLGKITKPNETTWKFLIEKILLALLGLYDGDRSNLMKGASEVLQIRHQVVHFSHNPSMDETNTVLSFVRIVLTIFEASGDFRSNWKLKSA